MVLTIKTHGVFVAGPDIDVLTPLLDPRFAVSRCVMLATGADEAALLRMAEVAADARVQTQVIDLADGWNR